METPAAGDTPFLQKWLTSEPEQTGPCRCVLEEAYKIYLHPEDITLKVSQIHTVIVKLGNTFSTIIY